MARFRYKARDEQGGEYSETIEATSLHAATDQLRSTEVDVIGIELLAGAPRRFEPVGQRPPPAPRDVEVGLNATPGGSVLVLVGGIFTALASVMIIAGLVALAAGERGGLALTLGPLIHLAVGVGLLVFTFGRRAKRRRQYRDGEVAMATIEGTGYNRTVRVNGSNPYELVWAFEIDGHRYHDKRSSFDEQMTTFVPGDRIWVLYDPADPEESVEWPPMS